MLTPFKTSSIVLVMLSSMSVPICNCFHAGRVNSGKLTTFKGVPSFDTCTGLIEPRGSRLKLQKFAFNATKSYAGCLGLYLAISSQFSVEMCAASKNCENFLKTLGVQGRSRSLMLINLKSPSPVLVMISSMSVPICNRFHITRSNISK